MIGYECATKRVKIIDKIIDDLDEMVISVDRNGVINYYNKTFQAMFMLKKNVKYKLFDLIESKKKIKSNSFEVILKKGKSVYAGKMKERKIGNQDFYIFSYDQQTHSVLNNVTEDTSKKKELKQFKVIAENASFGIATADMKGKLIYVNEYFAKVHGFSIKELIGKNLRVLHSVKQRKDILRILANFKKSGHFSSEVAHKKKDGTEFPMLMSGSIVYGEDGQPEYMSVTAVDNTEQAKLSTKINENESKLIDAQEMVNLGYWFWDIKTGNVEWSKQVFKIFGLNSQKFKPQIDSIMKLSPWPGESEKHQQIMKLAIKSHKPGKFEQKFLRPDKSIGYYYSSFKGVYDEKQKLIAIRGTVQDITELKKAEETLQDSLETSKNIVNSIPSGLFIYKYKNKKLYLVDANVEAEKLTGIKVKENIGKEFNQIWKEAKKNNLREKFSRPMRNGRIYESEDLYYQDQKLTGAFRVKAFRMPDSKLGVAFENITKMKQAQRLAVESQQRYIETLQNINLLSVMLDQKGKIMFANKFLLKITGWKLNEIIGKSWFTNFLPKDSRKKVYDYYEKFMDKKGNIPKHFENPILTKNGKVLHIRWNNTTLQDENGLIVGTSALGEDITKQREYDKQLKLVHAGLEEKVKERTSELQKAYIELKDLDFKKDQFISISAHELKTPLTSIRGFTQLLQTTDDLKPELRSRYLGLINKNTERLYKLVLDLIDSSRLSVGKLKMNITEVKLSDVFQDIKDNMSIAIRNKGLKFNTRCLAKINLKADYARLLQVIRNLIANSIEYTNKGSITFSATQKGGFVIITVKDTGIGIKKSQQKYIFDKFYQAGDEFRKRISGSGLGLSISKGLVESMGGRIVVESVVDIGSSFKIIFPISNNKKC